MNSSANIPLQIINLGILVQIYVLEENIKYALHTLCDTVSEDQAGEEESAHRVSA